MMQITMSICTFESGDFDVMIKCKATGRSVCLTGNQRISDDDLGLITDIAPACVWTDYERITKPD